MKNIILLVITIILLIIVIYKLKYPFWSKQPVFHYHNIKYWLIPPGIIQHSQPEKNKYYDSKIYFDTYENILTQKKALFANFIKKHYLPHKAERYYPPKMGVLNFFKHHNKKAYLSMIYDKNNVNKLIGTMSSRPLTCFIGNNKLSLQYVDFLCVHKKYRKMGVAPKIIYSHYVNARNNIDNSVFLFKREGDSTLIVPLTTYKNYFFDTYYWDKFVTFDQPNINTILITNQTFNLFIEVYEKLMKSNFKCIICPNLNHLKLLVKDKQIFITVTLIDNIPCDFFVFHNTYTTYNDKNSLELISSFKETDESVFVLSFMCSLSLIFKYINFNYLFIENISNNNIILKKILARYSPINKLNGSYYFYNFGYRPFESKNVMIIN